MKLTTEQRHSLISGFFLRHRAPHRRYTCPSDIVLLIDAFCNDTSYEYTIDSSTFSEHFLSSAPGDRLHSDSFDCACPLHPETHSFSFRLIVYPNGCNEDSRGSVDVMLECASNLDELGIEALTYYLILYCPQTGNETRGCRVISNESNSRRWVAYSMRFSECQKLSRVSFKCYVEVLRIKCGIDDRSWSSRNSGSSETLLNRALCTNYVSDNDGNRMHSNIEYRFKFTPRLWSINIIWGQTYYSSNFNGNYWSLICIPKGHTFEERQKFKLRLRLLRIPWKVSAMKIEYSLRIQGVKEKMSDVAMFTILNRDNCNNYHLVFGEQDTDKLNDMASQSGWTACVTLKVVALFDMKERLIPHQKWRQHQVIYQCDPVKLQ